MARTLAVPFTQKEMAKELGVSQPAISQMLAGKPEMIGLAIRWIELTITLTDFKIVRDKSGKPVQHYAVSGVGT